MHGATECTGVLNSPVYHGGQQQYEHVDDIVRPTRAPQRDGKVADETLHEAATFGAAGLPPGRLKTAGWRSPGAVVAYTRCAASS